MLKQSEYKNRRQALLAKMAAHSIAIIPAAHDIERNFDNTYPFRQENDFYYLSGFDEADALMLLVKQETDCEYILFSKQRDAKMELWTGPIIGQAGAQLDYAADQAFDIESLNELLPSFLLEKKHIYYKLGVDRKLDDKLIEHIDQVRHRARSGAQAPTEIINPDDLIHELRLHKSEAEQAIMRQACQISVSAHQAAMKATQPGKFEYQVEATLHATCAEQGARFQAYPSIVAGGKNACTLHYTANNAELNDGDLLLIDAGCELQNYASDITRTFPVNGKFSPEQRAIYELVLKSQLAAIEIIKPGSAWDAAQQIIVKIITEGLVALDILQGEVEQLIEDHAYAAFYMHRSGHWLGLDTHDRGVYKIDNQWRVLEPGMVLTVEPGIYIAPDAEVDEKWRGIGVRIEDDVLVTATGNEVLSAGLIKSVDDIEAFMKKD